MPRSVQYQIAALMCLVGFAIYLIQYQQHIAVHESYPIWILFLAPICAFLFYLLYRRAKKRLLILLPFLGGTVALANGLLLAGLALAILAAALGLGLKELLEKVKEIERKRQEQMTNEIPAIVGITMDRDAIWIALKEDGAFGETPGNVTSPNEPVAAAAPLPASGRILSRSSLNEEWEVVSDDGNEDLWAIAREASKAPGAPAMRFFKRE